MLVGPIAESSPFFYGDLTVFSGPDRFDEAMAYVEKHRLYDLALSVWEGTEDYKVSSAQLRCSWCSQLTIGNPVCLERIRRTPVREERVLAGSSGYGETECNWMSILTLPRP